MRCDNSVLKSRAVPLLVFCGLPPVDDGGSRVGDVTPIADIDEQRGNIELISKFGSIVPFTAL